MKEHQRPRVLEHRDHVSRLDLPNHANQRMQQSENESTDITGRYKGFPYWVSVTRDWVSLSVSILTLLLLGATALYARNQWLSSRDAVTAANTAISDARGVNVQNSEGAKQSYDLNLEALTTVQRAFLTFIPIRMQMPTLTTRAYWQGAWQNTGNTPATRVWDRTRIYPIKADLPKSFGFPFEEKNQIGRFVLGAKSSAIVVNDLNSNLITLSGPIGYFYGWAVYKDAFKQSPLHLSEFCYQLTTSTVVSSLGSPGQLEGNAIQSCPQHSCFDNDCPDYEARLADVAAYEASDKKRDVAGRR